MANPISDNLKIGTIGELLVQIRLLQYGIQAAPPLKDSGNDLIGIKGRSVKFIQVKTTAHDHFPAIPSDEKIYDLLFIVRLHGNDHEIKLDSSDIYVIPKENARNVTNFGMLSNYLLNASNTGFIS